MKSVIAMALRDLEQVGIRTTCRIRVDYEREHTLDCIGIWFVDDCNIFLSPKLQGAALYRVLLHEIGHTLGLEHTRTGIMRARRVKRTADYQDEAPTMLQRRRWTAEIARLALQRKLKNFAREAA